MQETLSLGYIYFCKIIYIKLLKKLTVDQILTIYQMFHDSRTLLKEDLSSMQYITQNTITEFLNRQISLKTIVNYLVQYIAPTNNSNDLMNILICVEKCIKRGEYWNTVRSLVLRLPQYHSEYKRIIQKILIECIENEKLIDIEDVNNNLINQVSPKIISTLDKNIVERFKNLLIEKTENNSRSAIQNFGKNLSSTIASPDGNTNLLQIEPPERNSTFINKNPNESNGITKINGESYTLQLLGNFIIGYESMRAHECIHIFFVKSF